MILRLNDNPFVKSGLYHRYPGVSKGKQRGSWGDIMKNLYFSTYARLLKDCAEGTDNASFINALLGCITIPGSLLNENGEVYYFDSSKSYDLISGKRTVQKRIVNAISDQEVQTGASEMFEINVIPMLDEWMLGETIEKIKAQYNLGSVDKNIEEDAEFLTMVLFYCLQYQNKKSDKNVLSNQLEEDVRIVNEKLQKIGRPEQISVPADIQNYEMKYVKELLRAYASDVGVQDFPFTALDEPANARYSKNFKNQREYFFNAESVRMSSRDMLLDIDCSKFDDLKQETYSIIREDVEDETYENGYKKLIAVIKSAANANVQSCTLAHIPNWIGPNVKKGICHFLVIDGKITWVD